MADNWQKVGQWSDGFDPNAINDEFGNPKSGAGMTVQELSELYSATQVKEMKLCLHGYKPGECPVAHASGKLICKVQLG